jgi:hypothetical protein
MSSSFTGDGGNPITLLTRSARLCLKLPHGCQFTLRNPDCRPEAAVEWVGAIVESLTQATLLLPAHEGLLAQVSSGVVRIRASCSKGLLDTHAPSAHHGAMQMAEFTLASLVYVLQDAVPGGVLRKDVWDRLGLVVPGPAALAANFEIVTTFFRSLEFPPEQFSQLWAGIRQESCAAEATCEHPPPRRKRRMSRAAANSKAFELAKADPAFLSKSQRAWADDIGCSDGLIAKLDLWKAKQKGAEDELKQAKSPKTVSLTDGLLAVTPDTDEELQRLIREHRVNFEPSPLDPDPPDRPLRVKQHKKL